MVPLRLLAKYTSNLEYFDLLLGIVMLQECANEQSMAIIRKQPLLSEPWKMLLIENKK